MYLEAKETARLYTLLSDKLGNDTTEAMFKYIDNKTERSVEATIKTLATKDDIAGIHQNFNDKIDGLMVEMAKVKFDLLHEISNVRKESSDSKADMIKWVFIFWAGQIGGILAIIIMLLKK